MIEYQTAEWAFTVKCQLIADGGYKTEITGRSPPAMPPKLPGSQLKTMRRFRGECFSGETRSEVIAACEKRIVEIGGEILSRIPSGEDEEE